MLKTIVHTVCYSVVLVVLLDVLILFASLGQIALENRTGEWHPFWRWQAEQVIKVIQ